MVASIVYAGAGNDNIFTWGGADTVYGEAGNDYIVGNSNCNLLDGGVGNDEIYIDSSSHINSQGYTEVYGGTGSDNISGYGIVHV